MFNKTSLKGRLNNMVALESILAVDVKSQTEKQIGGKGAMTELIISDLSLQVIEELRTVEEAVSLAARADVIAKIAKKIHRGLTVQNQWPL